MIYRRGNSVTKTFDLKRGVTLMASGNFDASCWQPLEESPPFDFGEKQSVALLHLPSITGSSNFTARSTRHTSAAYSA